jgi:hypothetical protein
MPKQEPVWEFMDKEAGEIIRQLAEKYPEKFEHIDAEKIGCVAIGNKEPPESQDWDAKILGITEPQLLYSKKTYVIEWFKSTWDSYNRAQRVAMLFRQLIRISPDFDGTLQKEDLKDCYCLVKAFGVGYMDSPALPDLTDQKQTL